jgi:hypothetical protein
MQGVCIEIFINHAGTIKTKTSAKLSLRFLFKPAFISVYNIYMHIDLFE